MGYTATTGKLREAYNAIRDRLEADSTFNNYFAMIDYDRITERIETPYCRVDFIGYETNPAQITKQQSPYLDLSITLEVNPSDDNRVAETLLNAIEIFENAYFGTDPTFGTIVLRTEINFDSISQTDKNTIVGTGLVRAELQHYSQGGL